MPILLLLGFGDNFRAKDPQVNFFHDVAGTLQLVAQAQGSEVAHPVFAQRQVANDTHPQGPHGAIRAGHEEVRFARFELGAIFGYFDV